MHARAHTHTHTHQFMCFSKVHEWEGVFLAFLTLLIGLNVSGVLFGAGRASLYSGRAHGVPRAVEECVVNGKYAPESILVPTSPAMLEMQTR